jgi:hypothetical protein
MRPPSEQAVLYRAAEVVAGLGALNRCAAARPRDAAVPAPLPIRIDRGPTDSRRLARRERDGRICARLLALANALEGTPREEAARLAGMTGQTLGLDRVAIKGPPLQRRGVEALRDRPRRGLPPRPVRRPPLRPCHDQEGVRRERHRVRVPDRAGRGRRGRPGRRTSSPRCHSAAGGKGSAT